MDHNDYGGLHEDLKLTGFVEGYEPSARTKQRISLSRDSVFRDGVAQQMAEMTGDPAAGYTARLTVAV